MATTAGDNDTLSSDRDDAKRLLDLLVLRYRRAARIDYKVLRALVVLTDSEVDRPLFALNMPASIWQLPTSCLAPTVHPVLHALAGSASVAGIDRAAHCTPFTVPRTADTARRSALFPCPAPGGARLKPGSAFPARIRAHTGVPAWAGLPARLLLNTGCGRHGSPVFISAESALSAISRFLCCRRMLHGWPFWCWGLRREYFPGVTESGS